MKLNEYEGFCSTTDKYIESINNIEKDRISDLLYLTTLCSKLSEECGELTGLVGKSIRDKNGKRNPDYMINILAEIGDVVWYLSRIANYHGYTLNNVLDYNYSKLSDRMDRNTIHGSGDNR